MFVSALFSHTPIVTGPNLGVEHTALAKAVLNSVQKDLGVEVDEV